MCVVWSLGKGLLGTPCLVQNCYIFPRSLQHGILVHTTCQNLWSRINSSIKTARSAVSKNPLIFFLQRQPRNFEYVKLVARWREHLQSFLAEFFVAELPQKRGCFNTQEFTRFLSTGVVTEDYFYWILMGTLSCWCSMYIIHYSQIIGQNLLSLINSVINSLINELINLGPAQSTFVCPTARLQGWSSPPRRFANSAAWRHQKQTNKQKSGFVRPLWNENEQWNEHENADTAQMNTAKTETQVLNKALPPKFTHSNAFARQYLTWNGGFSTFYSMVTSRQLSAKTLDPNGQLDPKIKLFWKRTRIGFVRKWAL